MAAPDTDRVRTLYDRNARLYDLLEWPVERALYRRWRRRLWADLRPGRLLEVGVGTGRNIPFHPADVAVRAIDLSPGMLAHARKSAAVGTIDLQIADVQALPFPDATYDAVVGSFVFCSVPDPVRGLEEVRRVLRPGGELRLLEHVRSDRPGLGRLLDLLNGLIVRLTGVNVNRRTVAAVEGAGFHDVQAEHLEPGHLYVLIKATAPGG